MRTERTASRRFVRAWTSSAAAVLAVGALPAPANAQPADLAEALDRSRVRDALAAIDGRRDQTALFLARIGAIVSPSGQEHERAEVVAARMREIGLDSVRVTGSPNTIGVIPGRSGRALVFVSTLDDLATVAEHQRAAGEPPRYEGDRVVGPGTNTSLTTAAGFASLALTPIGFGSTVLVASSEMTT